MKSGLKRLLQAAALDELDQAGQGRLGALLTDPAARERARRTQALGRALRALPAPQAPAELAERTMARLAALPATKPALALPAPPRLLGLAFAVVAVFHLALWLAMKHMLYDARLTAFLPDWFARQPAFFQAAAIFFALGSLAIQRPTPLIHGVVRLGVLAYLALLVADTLHLRALFPGSPLPAGLFGLLGSGAAMALVLATCMERARVQEHT